MSNKPTGTLYIISAPSGAGKTSLISALVDEMPNLMISVSYTTRGKRPGELEGVHYNYVDQAEFDRLQAQGVFMEHATVFGQSYGTSKDWVEAKLVEGVDVLLEIDWQGAAQICQLFADNSVSLFIVPPSLDILGERLRARKQDAQEVIAKRMALAQREISHLKDYDYVIINDDFERALRDMKAVVTAQRLKCDAQLIKNRQILSKLLAN